MYNIFSQLTPLYLTYLWNLPKPICLRGSLHGWTCLRLECWQVPQQSRRIGRTVQHKTDFSGFLCSPADSFKHPLEIPVYQLFLSPVLNVHCCSLAPSTLFLLMFSTNGSSWTRSLLDNFSFKNHSLKTPSLLDGLQPTWDT